MNWGLEIGKWIYVLVVSTVVFLFFCLFLDLFCLVFFGWNPLLGAWPIFSGTISLLVYGNPVMVLVLVAALASIARIMLGERIPYLLASLLSSSEENV